LLGANALGVELAKNIILSGVKRFVIQDTKKAAFTDLAGQFFLGEQDIGFNRAEKSAKKL
jgi:ubiquitin-activating enzyme E1